MLLNFLCGFYLHIQNSTIFQRTNDDNTDDGFDYMDDIADIIGDDVFALFLNVKGEIEIENIIYKYTDVGLFYTRDDKIDQLNLYLGSNNISGDLKIPTDDSVKLVVKGEFPDNGKTDVDSNITYFRMTPVTPPPSNDPGDDTGGGGGSPTTNDGGAGGPGAGGVVITPGTATSTGPPPSPGTPAADPTYIGFLNNLQDCSPHSGIFGTLFGDNHVCIDKYESNRRVKTKAFNYDYLVVYHMGVKVVHQFKGWTGFWRVEATDEIRVVVEAAQFQYDFTGPSNTALIYNQSQERGYYLNDQKIIYSPNNMTVNNFTYSSLNSSSLPQIFQNDGQGLSFEFFETGSGYLDNLIQNGLDSGAGPAALNHYFYNELYNTITDQLRVALGNYNYTPPTNRTFVAKYPDNGKMIVQKSLTSSGLNHGVADYTFDWGAEAAISLSDNGDSAWSISGGGPGNQLVRPKNFKVKIIGAANCGGVWHGSKFSFGIN